MSLNKGGNFLSREPVSIRGGKEIVFVRGVNLSQMKKKVLEINPNARFAFKERTHIKTDTHFE